MDSAGNTRFAPAVVPGIQAVSVSAGTGHTCAVLTDGTARCWGFNEHGELGNGASGNQLISPNPQVVAGIANAVMISAGWEFSCAALSDNTLKCWGSNDHGKLGAGSSAALSATPVAVTGFRGPGPVAVSAGNDHACGAGLGQTARCWGSNASGQLRDGTTHDSNVPVP